MAQSPFLKLLRNDGSAAAAVPSIAPTIAAARPAVDSKMAPDDKLSPGDKLQARSFILTDGTRVEPRFVKQQQLAQDGHSPAEHQVYQALWNAGGEELNGDRERPSPPYRDVIVGQTFIARKTSISKRNLIRILGSLHEKFSIETLQTQVSADHTAKTYRVWSMKEILNRRRERGFSWIYRNRNAVALARLVTAGGSSGSSSSSSDKAGDKLTPDAKLSPGDKLTPDQVTNWQVGPGDKLAPPLGTRVGTEQGTSSSQVSPVITETFRRYCPVDDDAIRSLVKAVLQVDNRASEDEIAYFLAVKAEQLRHRRDIQNFVGLLIASVPRCFTGSLISQFREERQLRTERVRAEAERTLNNPESSAEELEWAREQLLLAG